MILSSRLIGSEDGDGCTCAHPDDATTIAHTKSKLHDREFLNRVLYSNSGAIDSNSTMARTSKTCGSARNFRTNGPTETGTDNAAAPRPLKTTLRELSAKLSTGVFP